MKTLVTVIDDYYHVYVAGVSSFFTTEEQNIELSITEGIIPHFPIRIAHLHAMRDKLDATLQ